MQGKALWGAEAHLGALSSHSVKGHLRVKPAVMVSLVVKSSAWLEDPVVTVALLGKCWLHIRIMKEDF